MRNKKVLFITQAAVIAAIYVVLTIFISAFNLASGAIQVRVSEALTVLPFFTPAAIPGLAIGCFLSNLITGAAVYDVVFGSLATLAWSSWNLSFAQTQVFVYASASHCKYGDYSVRTALRLRTCHGSGRTRCGDSILHADGRGRGSYLLLYHGIHPVECPE